jgi:hypothetical protein
MEQTNCGRMHCTYACIRRWSELQKVGSVMLINGISYCELHKEIPKLNPTVCTSSRQSQAGQTTTREYAATDASLQSKGTDSNLMKRLLLTLCKYKSELSDSVRFQTPLHSVYASFALHRCSPVFHVLIRIRRPTLISRTQPLTTSLFV